MTVQLGIRVRRQRGAATLIAAVLLLSVVMVALSLGLLNANTDITDTALQGDGIEALFIAESGLENAIWRFDNGTGCGALALSDSVGRGNFSINNGTAAGLPATQCRVQVTGTVTQSNTARTIEAVITQAVAGGTVTLNNPGFEAGACPPGPDNWTITKSWGGPLCDTLVNNPPGANNSRVLYSRVTEGGTFNFNSTTAQQAISCTTAAGGNTVFTIGWDYRYDESPGSGGQKSGRVSVRFISSTGTSYPSPAGASRTYNGDAGWATDSVNITVPAGVTLTTFELVALTQRRSTVELWVDDLTITRASGPGCEVAAQPLTFAPVPRP